MATETTTRLVDDLEGSDAERAVTFTWDGRTYEVDLSKKNIAAFEKTMKPYLAVARSTRAASTRPAGRSRQAGTRARRRDDLQVIRDWARANGHSVSDRGRVSASIIEAYEATR